MSHHRVHFVRRRRLEDVDLRPLELRANLLDADACKLVARLNTVVELAARHEPAQKATRERVTGTVRVHNLGVRELLDLEGVHALGFRAVHEHCLLGAVPAKLQPRSSLTLTLGLLESTPAT